METACGLFIVNNKNEIVLGHATNAPENYFSIPKGIMEKGETYMETAIRETFEETNLKINLKSDKIKKILEFDIIRYPKTKKQLKSYAIIFDDDFSNVELKCTSSFTNKRGVKIMECDKVMWYPLNFKTDSNFSHIKLHETQEIILLDLIKKLKN